MKSTLVALLSLALLGSVSLAPEIQKRDVGDNNDVNLDDRELSLLAQIMKRKLEEREEEKEKREQEEETKRGDKEELRSLLRRVIGGTEVEEGVWPWLVSLQGELPVDKWWGVTIRSADFYCGASLINKRWILTAAHCFDNYKAIPEKYWDEVTDAENYEARLGDTELEASWWEKGVGFIGDLIGKDSWKLKNWEIDGEAIFIHPGYDRERKWENDIALMKLEEDVPDQPDIVEEIQSIKLAEAESDTFPRKGQQCVFKGWGCKESGGRVSDKAFEVKLPILGNDKCGDLWNIDTKHRLCAGEHQANKGICPGDSGGPLVCKSGNTWVQVGIASFTASEAPGQYPGAFTRVSAYADWIKKTIAEN